MPITPQALAKWLADRGEDAALFEPIIAATQGLRGPLGVAVSGGSDSLALLNLMVEWSQLGQDHVFAVTVDHNLRDGSAAEAQKVAEISDRIGVAHDTLTWADWNGQGNLLAAAREARFRMIGQWAKDKGIATVVLGHTMDDVAETYLMRLARKAGIDGLAAMEGQFNKHGVLWQRPLLSVPRAALRDYLDRKELVWIDDPSNENTDFDRVRVRQALPALSDMGVTPAVLHHGAGMARQARDALEFYARAEAARLITVQQGDLILQDVAFVPVEVQRRLWAKAIQWVGRLDYPPRATTLQHLRDGFALDGRTAGGGCLVSGEGRAIRVTREANAVKAFTCSTTDIWDTRWQLDGPHAPDLCIAALGDGIRDCPNWRDTGLPRASLMASPAIWRGETLVAAPIAGYNQGWTARIVADFHIWLDAH